jgi:putative DNA primase/helicase
MDTAIIVNGSQGSGKNLFFERIVGQLHGGAKVLTGRAFFDPHRLSAFAAETTYAVLDGYPSDRLAGQLKHLLASSTLFVRRPYESSCDKLKNTLNLVVICHGDDFLPLDSGSRRFVTIEAPPPHGPALYSGIDFEIKHGGIEAFRNYLLNELAMGGFSPATPPPRHGAPTIPQPQPERATAPMRASANGRAA